MADQELPEEKEERESKQAHSRLVLPLLIPATVFLFAVLVIYGLSRIYLELNDYKVGDVTMATPLAIGVSLLILLAAAYLVSQPTISILQIVPIFVVAAGLLTAGSVWAAVHEESNGEEHVENGATPPPDGSPQPPGTIAVGLHDPDFAVTADPAMSPPGPVTFAITNEGTIPHNFRLVQTDLDAGGLPVDSDTFMVDESQLDVIAETGNIQAGQAEEAMEDLQAGPYVIFCNVPAHYEGGMYSALTVQ